MKKIGEYVSLKSDGEGITQLPVNVKYKGYVVEISGTQSDLVDKTLKPGDLAAKTEKYNYEDTAGNKATIPEGFKVSEKPGEQTINDGLVVIENGTGNEFVWIPCTEEQYEEVDLANATEGVSKEGSSAKRARMDIILL